MSTPPRITNRPSHSVTKDVDSSRWQQVLARDPHADGLFFYGVKSTGIYCRPTCPSRRPAQHNVTFFPTADSAEQSGFRACKRCQPREAAGKQQTAIVAKAAEFMARNASSRVSLTELARVAGTNRIALLRAFQRVLGITPGEFARSQRRITFQRSLRATPGANAKVKNPKRITDAIYEAGFGSSSRLYEGSKEFFGMTPSTLRAGAPGLSIRYSTADTPLGRMLVAATSDGICAITFGSDDSELVSELQRRFSKASLVPASDAAGWLADAVKFVLNQLSEHPAAATFPLDIRATAFQQRVWKALQQIPRGETRTYSQVARELGQPTAVRAVASAIGSNPVALAVPCHRVIGSDGSLTGYRWGLERKRKLLEAEKQSSGCSVARTD